MILRAVRLVKADTNLKQSNLQAATARNKATMTATIAHSWVRLGSKVLPKVPTLSPNNCIAIAMV
jgi:hypothetical protein